MKDHKELDVWEWQTKGVEEAIAEANSANATWVGHKDLLAGREARVADKMA